MAGRISIQGTQAVAVTFAKDIYDYRFKDAVLAHFLAGCTPGDKPRRGRMEETLQRFFSHHCGDPKARESKRKLIYAWVKEADSIIRTAATSRGAATRKLRPLAVGTVLHKDTEERIVEWICDLRRDGVPISSLMFQQKVLEIAIEVGVDGRLKASPSFQHGFLRRHDLAFRCKTHQSQMRLAEAERVAHLFALEVVAKIRELNLSPADVLNADQTAVFFELLPKKTIDAVGVKTVWVKCGSKEKDRVTVMVMASMDGFQFDPFIVFKATPSKDAKTQQYNDEKQHGFGRIVWPKIVALQDKHNMTAYGNRAGWWNADIHLAFLKLHFGDRHPLSPPKLLLLDHFSGHWTADVKAYASSVNVHLMQVPAGMTWRCQPADVAWMKPLKDNLRKLWVDSLRAQLSAPRPDGQRFKMAAPSREELAGWIRVAWDRLTPGTIQNGFRACGFSAGPTAAVETDHITDASTVLDLLQQEGVDCTVQVTDDMDILSRGHTEEIPK